MIEKITNAYRVIFGGQGSRVWWAFYAHFLKITQKEYIWNFDRVLTSIMGKSSRS